jgi:uncharacterized protein (DUF2267 family)
MAIDPQAALADEPLRRYDRFVALASDMASLSLPEAERLVFRTLRETLPRPELDDILAELPREYDDLLGR